MVLCLGEPPRRFFVLLFIHFCSSFSCCSSFIFVLHFISRLLCHVTGTPPWLLKPVKASTSSELYLDYFWMPLLFHLPQAPRFWVDVFYPHAFFTLRSFTGSFDSTCVYQGFPGSRQLFLEVCRASYWSSKHIPGPSVYLIHSNPQKVYTGRFYLSFMAARICEESACSPWDSNSFRDRLSVLKAFCFIRLATKLED